MLIGNQDVPNRLILKYCRIIKQLESKFNKALNITDIDLIFENEV